MNAEDRGRPGALMHCEINFASALTSLLLPPERKIIFQLVFPLVLRYPNLIIQASTCSVHLTPYWSWPAEHNISYSDFVSRRTPSKNESSILVIRCPLPCFVILCTGSFILWHFHKFLVQPCCSPVSLFCCLLLVGWWRKFRLQLHCWCRACMHRNWTWLI